MTGTLMPQIFLRALDANGKPVSGAKLFSYLTGTSTPTPTYTDATLGTPLTNPILADSGGLFAAIFLNTAVVYRFVLTDASGSQIGNTMDPVSGSPAIANGGISSAMLAAGVAVANLGFTPVNQAGDLLQGEVSINYNLSSPPLPQSLGFRGMPAVIKNANYTFAPDDSGRFFIHDDGSAYTWAIPLDSSVLYPTGTIIGLRNAIGSGVISLTRIPVTMQLTLAGSLTDKNITVAAGAFGSLTKEGANTWVVAGSGFS